MQALFASTAVRKYQDGRKQELTFADACRFWSITENLAGPALDARLHGVRAALAEIERAGRQGRQADARATAGHFTLRRRQPAVDDLHLYLEDRFSRHLTLLRNRAGRN